jgi:hypothetical protein
MINRLEPTGLYELPHSCQFSQSRDSVSLEISHGHLYEVPSAFVSSIGPSYCCLKYSPIIGPSSEEKSLSIELV